MERVLFEDAATRLCWEAELRPAQISVLGKWSLGFPRSAVPKNRHLEEAYRISLCEVCPHRRWWCYAGMAEEEVLKGTGVGSPAKGQHGTTLVVQG